MLPPARLHNLLSHFPGRRILVVGDVMLDVTLSGPVQRLSPEAPVPIVELQEQHCAPGGAANAAANVASLGGVAILSGLTGTDANARLLRQCLQEEHGIRTNGLLTERGRPTTTKTRVRVHGQQVLRLDHECRNLCTAALEGRFRHFVARHLPRVDACILSDYAKGVVSSSLAFFVLERARALGKPVVVDPKGRDFRPYAGATVVKPNLHEARRALDRALRTEADVHEGGERLLALVAPAAVLLTRGGDGMTLFEPGRKPVHIAAQTREVFDVTGAGDTVAATLALALAAGATLAEAAQLASRAAGLGVSRIGTAPVSLDALTEAARDLFPPGANLRSRYAANKAFAVATR